MRLNSATPGLASLYITHPAGVPLTEATRMPPPGRFLELFAIHRMFDPSQPIGISLSRPIAGVVFPVPVQPFLAEFTRRFDICIIAGQPHENCCHFSGLFTKCTTRRTITKEMCQLSALRKRTFVRSELTAVKSGGCVKTIESFYKCQKLPDLGALWSS
jgi:hypothetical protein